MDGTRNADRFDGHSCSRLHELRDGQQPVRLCRIDPYTGQATLVGATGAGAPIVGAGFVDDTLFTFGGAVNQPNQIYSIDLETGAAQFVADQAAALEPVFGAFSVARVRHHSRGGRGD